MQGRTQKQRKKNFTALLAEIDAPRGNSEKPRLLTGSLHIETQRELYSLVLCSLLRSYLQPYYLRMFARIIFILHILAVISMSRLAILFQYVFTAIITKSLSILKFPIRLPYGYLHPHSHKFNLHSYLKRDLIYSMSLNPPGVTYFEDLKTISSCMSNLASWPTR